MLDATSYDMSTVGDYTVKVSDPKYAAYNLSFEIEVLDKQATAAVFTAPTGAQLTYIQDEQGVSGQTIDTALVGAKWAVTYDDGSEADIPVTAAMCSSLQLTTIGTETITVTFSSGTFTETATFDIEVVAPTLESIAVTTQPTKVEYKAGVDTELSKEGGKITATYNNKNTEGVFFNNEEVTFSEVNFAEPVAEQPVTVTYKEKTATFNIAIKDELTSIAVNGDFETEYKYGEELNLTKGKVVATYSSDKTKEIALSDVTITGYDKNAVGDQTLTITYNQVADGTHFAGEKTTTTGVKVFDELKSITVSGTKAEYKYNEDLDLTQGKVVATYASGKTNEIALSDERINIADYNKTKLGAQTLKVTYTQAKDETNHILAGSAEATFDVAVKDALESIALKKGTKTEYNQGESLDFTIVATYLSDTTKEVKFGSTADLTINTFDKNAVGEQEITVSYKQVGDNTYLEGTKTTLLKVKIYGIKKAELQEKIEEQVKKGEIITNLDPKDSNAKKQSFDPIGMEVPVNIEGVPSTVTINEANKGQFKFFTQIDDKEVMIDQLTTPGKYAVSMTFTPSAAGSLSALVAANPSYTLENAFTVTVAGVMEVTVPTKDYKVGDKLDPATISIKMMNGTGTEEILSGSDARVSLTGFDSSKVGVNTVHVAVEIGGKIYEAQFDVNIIAGTGTGTGGGNQHKSPSTGIEGNQLTMIMGGLLVALAVVGGTVYFKRRKG